MANEYEDQLAQQGGAFEPQRQHTFAFRVMLAGAAGLGGGNAPQDALNVLSSGGDTLELSVRSAFLPSESSEEIEIPHMNGRVYVAGKYQFETGSVVFHDYLDKGTANIIKAWRKLVADPETGRIGMASVYKRKGEVVMYAPDFSIKRWWDLHGLWPQMANFGALDYSASDVAQVEVTFRFDKAIPHLDPTPV